MIDVINALAKIAKQLLSAATPIDEAIDLGKEVVKLIKEWKSLSVGIPPADLATLNADLEELEAKVLAHASESQARLRN